MSTALAYMLCNMFRIRTRIASSWPANVGQLMEYSFISSSHVLSSSAPLSPPISSQEGRQRRWREGKGDGGDEGREEGKWERQRGPFFPFPLFLRPSLSLLLLLLLSTHPISPAGYAPPQSK
jgi:hypothetical protein